MRSTASILIPFALATAAFGQMAPGKLQFEVASIRPAAPITAGTQSATAGVKIDGAQLRASMMSLKDYFGMAYELRVHQIEGPDWLASKRWEIAATLPEGHSTPKEVSAMLAALLEDRFQIKSHREKKDFPVYALQVAKGGIKAVEAPLDPEERTITAVGTGGPQGTVINFPRGASLSVGSNRIEAKKFAMQALADTLARFMDRPVVDETGLTATYDISLTLAPEDFGALMVRSAIAAGINLPPQAMKVLEVASGDSLHRELDKAGLKLEAKKAPMEVLVIDSIAAEPSAN
jgi:uncharacterized protein (TIGR03435 family)